MRVLLVSTTYPPRDISGVGTLVRELAVRLLAGGHEVSVLTRRGKDPRVRADPWVRTVPGGKLLFPFVVVLGYLWHFSRWPFFGRRAFDVIHIHESDGFGLAWLHRLARCFRMPLGRARLVATLQVSYRQERRKVDTIFAERPTRGRPEPRVLSEPTSDERSFRRFRAPVHSFLGRRIARWADVVVAPSRVTRAELECDYEARRVEVIGNGLELAPSRPVADVGASGHAPRCLYVGRLRTRKAVAVLVEAFARLHEQFPGATLRIVGSGVQRGALEAQIRRLVQERPGLQSAIEPIEAIDQHDISSVYAEADLFVLPSTYEGLPLVLLEAMAAGLPCVATDVSGNPEAVLDGTTGLLVPARDVESLREAMARLAADPDLRRRFGAAGRRRVEEHFTIERIADEYLNLWRQQVGESPRAVKERA